MVWKEDAKNLARKFFGSDNIRFIDIPEVDAIYIWEPIKGGKALIIDSLGNKVGATSAVGFEKHLEEFKRRR